MDLHEFDDYRTYLTSRVRAMPSRGKGEFRRLATRLGVHPSLISQIMKGRRDFSPEQAVGVADALGLKENETEYFLALVDLARAGSEALKAVLRKRLKVLRDPSASAEAEVSPLASPQRPLSEAERAVFYSNWFYSAIRLRSAIVPAPSIDTLSSDLDLPRALVRQVVDFLVEKGLCVEKLGRVHIGPSRTWIDQTSPLVLRHHQNWRMKAIERMPRKGGDEFFLTLPMTVATKDIPQLKDAILEFEKAVHGILDTTESEELVCLNVDFFKL